MNTTKTVTITRRTRNLGYGSTSQPVRGANGRLGIDSVDAPDVVGGVKAIRAEHDRQCRRNSGHDWSYELFVNGKRVVGSKSMAMTDLAMLTAREGKGFYVDSITLAVEAD